MQIRALLRTTTFRLSAFYGLIFALGLVALLGLVYLRSAVYLTARVDGILATEAAALAKSPPSEVGRRIDEALVVGDLNLDLAKREVRRGGRRIDLLPMEFKLLEFMMRNAGQILSRRLIFEAVWEYYFDPGTNLIDVHVGRLRRKIDVAGLSPLFRTERGVGYMLDAT